MLSLHFILPVFMASAVLCYDAKFDKIDVDLIINDKVLFASYTNCFLDKDSCTAEFSSELKELLPEVISDACAKCTKIQKANLRKMFKYLYEEKKEVLLELEKKYDPKNQYKDNFMAILESKDE
ncbi:unnamed protein product, partial [Brenthis ino]